MFSGVPFGSMSLNYRSWLSLPSINLPLSLANDCLDTQIHFAV